MSCTKWRVFVAFALAAMLSACVSIGTKGGKDPKENADDSAKDSGKAEEVVEENFERIPQPRKKGAAKVSDQAKAEFEKASAAMKGKRWQQAEGMLNLMVQTYPELSGPYVNLGIVYQNMDKLEEAEKAYRYALEKNNLNFDAYTRLGILYREQGKFKEAEQVYLEALKLWPHHAASLRNLGILYDMYMGRFADALEQYKLLEKVLEEPDRRLKGWIVDTQRRIAQSQPE